MVKKNPIEVDKANLRQSTVVAFDAAAVDHLAMINLARVFKITFSNEGDKIV